MRSGEGAHTYLDPLEVDGVHDGPLEKLDCGEVALKEALELQVRRLSGERENVWSWGVGRGAFTSYATRVRRRSEREGQRVTLTRSRSTAFIMVPWKNLTVV